MQLKTILNRVQKHPRFVYGEAELVNAHRGLVLHVDVRERKGCRPICSRCGRRRRAYDRLGPRSFEFVPLWGIAVFFLYAPRRVECPACGVVVEMLPWSDGKSPITTTYAWFLGSWAKSLSWTEVARRFGTSWAVVFEAVRRGRYPKGSPGFFA